MESIVDWIVNLPPNFVQTFGYLIAFAATVCEGIPPLGFFVPGQNIVIIVGFFASIDLLSPIFSLICIILWAWIGDLAAYWLGKKYGLAFLKKYGKYIMISDSVLESIEKILTKNLVMGTILSKFYAWTRGVLPFMAGSLKIKFSKILFYTGVTNLLWWVAFFLLGYFLGESYEAVAGRIGVFLTRGMIIGTAIAILFRYFKSEYNIFKKGFTFMTIGNIISIVLFSIIAQRLYLDKLSFVKLDVWIQNLMVKSPLVDTIMIRIDRIFDFWLIWLIGLAIIVYLYRKKLMYYLTVFVSSMLSALFFFPFIKMIIQRARPAEALIPLNDYSFPSGHATVSIVVCLLIWYVLQPDIKNKYGKIGFLILMIAATLLIGTSRIVLHVHRFTDVIGGFLLGFVILATNILVRKILFRTHLEQQKVLQKHSKKQLIDALIK